LALEPGKAPIAAIIGIAWLIGSGVLAWLSSPATLVLTRDNEDRVTAAIESRLFNVFTNRTERVDGIRSITIVPQSEVGADRIVFETPKGPVDLGRNQQLFAADYPEIADFFKGSGEASLALSSIGRGSELRRFVFAQAAALFMCLCGFGLLGLVISSLRAR